MGKRKLIIYSAIIVLLLAIELFLFFGFPISYDPFIPFLISSVVAFLLLIVIVISIVRLSKSKKQQRTFLIGDWAAFFGITILIISTLFTFFIRPARIDGESMKDALHPNDRVLTYIFNYTPEKGDVCPIYVKSDEKIFVKRIVAVEGDLLEAEEVESTNYLKLMVNGKIYSEEKFFSYADWRIISGQQEVSLTSLVYEYQIPEKKLLAIGDNFSNSKDSRALGLFDYQDVKGKVFFVFIGKKIGVI